MKIIKITLLLVLCSCSNLKKPLEKQKVEDWVIKKEVNKVDSPWRTHEGKYIISYNGCELIWSVSSSKKDKKINLRAYSKSEALPSTCPTKLSKKLELHKKVLTEIHKDFPLTEGSAFMTSELDPVPSNNEHNIQIILASLDSADYLDYKKNYPHHKSQKSANRILKELIKKNNIDKDLKLLFADFNLAPELESVEKVFTSRGTRIKSANFPAHLRNSKKRFMTGAGMYWFKLKRR